MTNYRKEWAEGEIEAGTLLDAIDELRERVMEFESSAVAKELIAARAELVELNARIREARELFEDINFNRQGIAEAKVEAWMGKTFFKG
jgi:hypothetical protein